MSESDKYREKLKSLLDKWIAEFDKLEEKIRKAGEDPKVDYDEQITALRQHRYKAKAKLEGFQKDSEDAWKRSQAGSGKHMDCL